MTQKGLRHSDQRRGLYRKYDVKRTDGSSGEGRKHEHCAYYVLDLVHDKHAAAALKAYADSCEAEFPELAAELRLLVVGKTCDACGGAGSRACGCRSVGECMHLGGIKCRACNGWGIARKESGR